MGSNVEKGYSVWGIFQINNPYIACHWKRP